MNLITEAPKETDKLKKINMSDKIDIKSRLGYFSEFVVAYELAVLIDKNGGRLTKRSTLVLLKEKMLTRKKALLSVITKKQEAELLRQETGGKLIAKQMFEDLILNGKEGNDYHTLEFDIELTGDSAKGVDKADIVLIVKKPSKNKTIDSIAASLKTYKTPNINLSNKTFTGFLKTITGDPEYENKSLEKFERIIFDSMVKKFMELKNIDRKLSEAIVGSGENFLKKYPVSLFLKLKEAGRAASKSSHPQVSKIIIDEFNAYYNKSLESKKKVNKALINLLGLDGGDDFYAAIGTAGKQKVLSSRKSQAMEKFLEDVKSKDLNIKMEPTASGKAINVEIFLKDKVIAKSSISFTDTGVGSKGMTKSKGAGKTNFWFNVKAFL
jgi:hypothetical protein